jgi:hypothetical protein
LKVAALYEALGYVVESNISLDGHLADLLIKRKIPGANELVWLVELKNYAERSVGVDQVRAIHSEVLNLTQRGRINGGILVSNTPFTAAATEAAREIVQLVTLDALKAEVAAYVKPDSDGLELNPAGAEVEVNGDMLAMSHSVSPDDIAVAAQAVTKSLHAGVQKKLATAKAKLERVGNRPEWDSLRAATETLAALLDWLTNNASLPDTVLPAARATEGERWGGFEKSLNRPMELGPWLSGEFPGALGPWRSWAENWPHCRSTVMPPVHDSVRLNHYLSLSPCASLEPRIA